MKRVACVLLLFAMLMATASVLGGCTNANGIRESGKIKIDLSEYTLVYPDTSAGEVTTTFCEQSEYFAQRLSVVTGVQIDARSETSVESVKNILVGETRNKASKSAKNSIKGEGFAIIAKKNRIVIAGTTPAMTMYAMQYLSQQYLTEQVDSTCITIPRKIMGNHIPVMELASSDGTDCTFVYDADLDIKEGNVWGEPGNTANYDYPYNALLDCVSNLAKATELKSNAFVKKADTAPSEENEILIGLVSRPEVEECLSEMPAEGYGVFVRNGKTLVVARSDTALGYAHGYFRDLTSDALVEREGGGVSVQLPVGLAITGLCLEKYITDFIKPDGLSLYNIQDVGDKSLQYLYMGDGVNADAFHAYCQKLEGDGYELRSGNKIEESLFATYVSEERNTTLYVAYNAFTHSASGYNYKPRLKVISASLDYVFVPNERLFSEPETFKKRTDASITALSMVETAVGMGYVIMLEDGSFVVFDGGRQSDTLARLWSVMESLHVGVYGKQPSAQTPLHISAWIVTHSHSDHFNVFLDFLDSYGKMEYVQIDYILGNFPSKSVAFNAAGRDMTLADAAFLLPQRVRSECQFIKIHTGQRYYFAGLEIEVLYTQEDANPIRLNLFNDTSCILRFTMHSHNADENGNAVKNKGAKAVTSVWTGDAFIYGCRFASAMYGSYLKSDMVQVAHHGNIGCESHFYNNVKPTAVWFPHTYDAYRNYTRGGVSAWQYKVDYDLVYGIGSVEYVYVSDTYCATVPLRANGADYAGVFDAITGESIVYGSRAAVHINNKK